MLIKMFFKSGHLKKIEIMICEMHSFIQNKIPKSMSFHGVTSITLSITDNFALAS